MSQYRERFKDAFWYDPQVKVTIGGLGSIGSWLTIFIGRLVDNIYVYDFDRVENINLAGQAYGESHVSMYKAEAIKDMNENDYNPTTTIHIRGKFEEGSAVTPICFSGFDNMLARKHMFESWKSRDDKEIFIDARLTAEEYWVYAVTPDKINRYQELLKDDSEIEELPCSFKTTTHISSMVASTMTVMFTNYLSNKKSEDIRNLPFQTIYRAPLNIYESYG